MPVRSFITSCLMLVIIFAAAIKTGQFGVNGTLLVDKYHNNKLLSLPYTRGMGRYSLNGGIRIKFVEKSVLVYSSVVKSNYIILYLGYF